MPESRWISVDEALPDHDCSTLICTRNNKVCTAHFYVNVGRWNAHAGKNAMYWMYLPEPPGCPCDSCKMRKQYAKAFDMHFYGEDCPIECERYDKWKNGKKKGK